MRFILLDRIDEFRPPQYARGMQLVAQPGPAMWVVEGLAQLGAWLILASTDFKKRPVLASLSEVVVHGEAPRGSAVILEAWLDEAGDDSAVMHGLARIGDNPLVEVRDLLCAMMDADRLEPVEQTRRMLGWLRRDAAP